MLLKSADYKRMPWKNGGGVTAEIWREPAEGDNFLWRLSIAEVNSDGPFSVFPGIDRQIMLLHGNGMALTHKNHGHHRLDLPDRPYAFSGDWETDCKLIKGHCRDFNLMVDRARASGQIEIGRLRAKDQLLLPARTAAIHLLEGSAEIRGEAMSARDTWIRCDDEDTYLTATRDSQFALILIERKA